MTNSDDLKAAEAAGFFTAHILTTLCKDKTFTPIAAAVTSNGYDTMNRLVGADFGTDLPEEITGTGNYVLLAPIAVSDPKIASTPTDMIGIRVHASEEDIILGLPFFPKKLTKRFQVGNVKLIDYPENWGNEEISAFLEAYAEGSASHPTGSAIWDKSAVNK